MSVDRNKDKYYATVQVGKDTIENAEYITFNSDVLDRPKRIKVRNDLWWNIKTPFYKMKRKITNIYYKVRYGFERMFNDYDSIDRYNTFEKFTERYSKILTDYRKNHWGYPYKVSSDEWDNIIDEMIYHLRYMNEDNVESELCKDVPENWTPTFKTVNEIMERHKDEFFKLFSKYFFDLWD